MWEVPLGLVGHHTPLAGAQELDAKGVSRAGLVSDPPVLDERRGTGRGAQEDVRPEAAFVDRYVRYLLADPVEGGRGQDTERQLVEV